jgi:signal transduction histidine kinase
MNSRKPTSSDNNNKTRQDLETKLRAAERLGYLGGSVRKLAHELRNPLNSIYLNLQLLEEDFKQIDNPDMLRRLQVSLKEVQRLEQILSDFLNFARSSVTELKPMDVNKVLQSFEEFIKPTSERDKIEVISYLGKELPYVLLDEKLFRSVLMNLYLNSAAAMPEGGTFTIRTRLQKKDKVLITLTDTGKGIPPESLKKVFDVFYTTKSSGSGLGLSLTRRAIEDMGGTISLDSSPGSVTTAFITLPIALFPVKERPMITAEAEEDNNVIEVEK